jgi:hypothetical protein
LSYFINVGRFKALKSKIGARGWHISRRGTTVIARANKGDQPYEKLPSGQKTFESWNIGASKTNHGRHVRMDR